MRKVLIFLSVIAVFSSFKQKQFTWVAIGDSITYLNDHKNETSDRLSKGYLTQVVDKLPNLRYINKGYNGWTAQNIAQRIDSLELVPADIYTIFLGTNDWWAGRPVGRLQDYKEDKGNSSFYGSFRIIINKIRRLNSKAKIILITPMQRADFVYIFNYTNNAYGSYKAKNGQYLEAFANAIDSIGLFERITVVDLYHDKSLSIEDLVKFKRLKNPGSGQYTDYPYPDYIGVPFDAGKDEYPYPKEAMNLTYDGLHPSDKGDSIIANRIMRALKR